MKTITAKTKKDDKDLRIQQLEKELEQIHEDMRGITEEQEAANEELQSANEELLSGSEELQSLNEELETSKEELESTNEELTVVNHEIISLNEQVTEARDYAEAIVASIRTPLLVLDKHFRIKSANLAFYKTFQTLESETEGKLIFDLGNGEWDIASLRTLLEHILPEKSKIVDYEVHHTFKSIGDRIMLLNAHEIRREVATEKLILLAIQDVTAERTAAEKIKESEKQFRQLADFMPQKIWTADAGGNINYFNKTWLDYTGLSFEELKDWGWEKIIYPDNWEENKKRWQHSIDTGNNFELEHRILNKDGEYKWHLSRGLAFKDENGKIIMWIGTNTDMHFIKEEEERKDDFIKMVSHELKTPVTSIKGYVQLLLGMLEEEQATEYPLQIKSSLVRIDKLVLRLIRLITEMLDLSRIETGRLELQKELFSLNGLVMETVEDILYTAPKQTINIYQDFSCNIYGDKDRIGQVIINFIANAIKYSPNNNKIEVRIHAAEKNQVAVSVKDYGIGIDKTDHKKIFERFYRVGEKSEQTYPGLGIGLFIANTIIERHKGFITVESEKGKGSVFTFILPVAAENKI